MKISNPNKKSVYSSQGDYFKGMNPSSDEFQSKIKDGSFQKSPDKYNYKASRELAKDKNTFR